jgi:hypothetical protein
VDIRLRPKGRRDSTEVGELGKGQVCYIMLGSTQCASYYVSSSDHKACRRASQMSFFYRRDIRTSADDSKGPAASQDMNRPTFEFLTPESLKHRYHRKKVNYRCVINDLNNVQYGQQIACDTEDASLL